MNECSFTQAPPPGPPHPPAGQLSTRWRITLRPPPPAPPLPPSGRRHRPTSRPGSPLLRPTGAAIRPTLTPARGCVQPPAVTPAGSVARARSVASSCSPTTHVTLRCEPPAVTRRPPAQTGPSQDPAVDTRPSPDVERTGSAKNGDDEIPES